MKYALFAIAAYALCACTFIVLFGYVSQDADPAVLRQECQVTVVRAVGYETVPGRDIANATLVFDKAVPNGEATMVVELADGRSVEILLWPVFKDARGKAVRRADLTTRLEAQWSPVKDSVTAAALVRRPVRLEFGGDR